MWRKKFSNVVKSAFHQTAGKIRWKNCCSVKKELFVVFCGHREKICQTFDDKCFGRVAKSVVYELRINYEDFFPSFVFLKFLVLRAKLIELLPKQVGMVVKTAFHVSRETFDEKYLIQKTVFVVFSGHRLNVQQTLQKNSPEPPNLLFVCLEELSDGSLFSFFSIPLLHGKYMAFCQNCKLRIQMISVSFFF